MHMGIIRRSSSGMGRQCYRIPASTVHAACVRCLYTVGH